MDVSGKYYRNVGLDILSDIKPNKQRAEPTFTLEQSEIFMILLIRSK